MVRRAVGFLGFLVLVACGGEEPEKKSGLSTSAGGSGGSGGMATITVGGSTGGKGGSGGSTSLGGSPALQLHECPSQPDPSCPSKVLPSYQSGTGTASTLQGVTEVTGGLEIGTVEELAQLDCLETVGDDLEIDFFGEDAPGPVTLWPLRNLRTTGGGVDIATSSNEVWADCGLRNLQSLGEQYLTGGAVDVSGLRGELDLSSVQKVTHIRIKGSHLTKVTLPSNVALTMGQLFFTSNDELTTVDGFQGVALTQSSIQVTGALSVNITDNPTFSNCRANELKAIFVAAGFSEANMDVSGNLADCP
jgi:hypothetical protein